MRRQVPLFGPGPEQDQGYGQNGRVLHLCRAHLKRSADTLRVEADGGQHADNVADERRTAWLERHGWRWTTTSTLFLRFPDEVSDAVEVVKLGRVRLDGSGVERMTCAALSSAPGGEHMGRSLVQTWMRRNR